MGKRHKEYLIALFTFFIFSGQTFFIPLTNNEDYRIEILDVTNIDNSDCMDDANTWPDVTVETIDTNEVVFCYNDNGGASGACRVVEINGDKFGTIHATSTFDGDIVPGTSTFRAVLGLCATDTDQWYVVFSDDSASHDGFFELATHSGGTITYHDNYEFETGDMEFGRCAKVDSDKAMVIFNDEANSDTTKLRILSNTGTSIDTGNSGATSTSGTGSECRYSWIEQLDTNKAIYCWEDQSSNTIRIEVATVSGSTITKGSSVDFPGANAFGRLVAMGTDRFVAMSNVVPGDNRAYLAGTVSGTTITLGEVQDFSWDWGETDHALGALEKVDDNTFVAFRTTNRHPKASPNVYYAEVVRVNWNNSNYPMQMIDRKVVVTDAANDQQVQTTKIGDDKYVIPWIDDDNADRLQATLIRIAKGA